MRRNISKDTVPHPSTVMSAEVSTGITQTLIANNKPHDILDAKTGTEVANAVGWTNSVLLANPIAAKEPDDGASKGQGDC